MSDAIETNGEPSFASDLRSTLRVLRGRPLLPVLTVLIWSAPLILPPPFIILSAPISIFSVGFPGTERLWLLKGFRGEDLDRSEIWRLTWNYWPRFFVLGLLMMPVVLVGGVLGWIITRSFVGVYVGITAATLVLDVTLTFVTPALAFLTDRVRKALGVGIRMIPREWPRNAMYVLIPPLAILLLVRLVPSIASARHFDENIRAALAGHRPEPLNEPHRLIYAGLSAASALLGLWFKGATTAFFARRFDVGPLGAANSVRLPPRPD